MLIDVLTLKPLSGGNGVQVLFSPQQPPPPSKTPSKDIQRKKPPPIPPYPYRSDEEKDTDEEYNEKVAETSSSPRSFPDQPTVYRQGKLFSKYSLYLNQTKSSITVFCFVLFCFLWRTQTQKELQNTFFFIFLVGTPSNSQKLTALESLYAHLRTVIFHESITQF